MRPIKPAKTPLGIALQEARAEAGLSRAEAARLLQIPIRTWQEWEAGNKTPPDYLVRLIVEELHRIAVAKDSASKKY